VPGRAGLKALIGRHRAKPSGRQLRDVHFSKAAKRCDFHNLYNALNVGTQRLLLTKDHYRDFTAARLC
jgi:hypothetical protein